MGKLIDITGIKFGDLTVLTFSHKDKRRQSHWECLCNCGNMSIVSGTHLKTGHTKTCGKNYFYEINGHMMGYDHKNMEFVFDKQDFDLIKDHSWSLTNGYPSSFIKGKFIYLHRLVLNPKTGELIDHINGNKLDNRKENLRLCTNQQNTFNSKKQKNCSSKYKGVCWDKNKNKWLSQIRINEKHVQIGRYKNEIDAAKAYNEVAKKYFGEFAKLNNI